MLDPTPYRELFPITRKHVFLNHASVSALNTQATEAIRRFNELTAELPIAQTYGQIGTTLNDLRERIATLINAQSPTEIVAMPNTAAGINTAALSIPFRPGDNVLLLDGDYPANIYPWMNLARRGVLTKIMPAREGGLDLNILESRIDSRTRAIALSTVQFASGYRNDLVAVGQICRERGLYFVVDGIQSLGALPFDVQAANVDFLACGSQKWLLGPMGSGFLYVRRERLDELVPGPYVGASSVVDSTNFLDYNFTLLPTADRFALGTPNIAGLIGLHASLSIIQEAGIEQIGERVLALTAVATEDLRRRGYTVSSNADPARRSGIMIVTVDQPEATVARLAEAGIITTPRGQGIRLAPHFYNTEEELLRVGETLQKC